MTEAEWLACEDSDAILAAIGVNGSHRKLQLFGVACCRRVTHLLNGDRCQHLIEKLELEADSPVPVEEQDQLIAIAESAADAESAPAEEPENAARWQATEAVSMCAQGVFGSAARFARYAMSLSLTRIWDEDSEEARTQAGLLREIFGNPFRPVSLDPLWLTFDVQALAQGIYAERAFDRMPILADALQDAGCENEDVLNHCRDAKQVHVRGCWVLDLLLGKG